MKIYHVHCDHTAVQVVPTDDKCMGILQHLQADPLGEYEPPACKLRERDADAPAANFYHLSDTALVYDDVAANVMDDFIEYAGELFSLEVEGVGTLTLVNVLEGCNALDKVTSQLIEGAWKDSIALNKLVFHKRRVSSLSSLFKIPDLQYGPILTVSDASNDQHIQEHDFHSAYHKARLTGLSFDLLWSDGGHFDTPAVAHAR